MCSIGRLHGALVDTMAMSAILEQLKQANTVASLLYATLYIDVCLSHD